MAKKQKNSAASYAYIGLVVAVVACISSGLLGLVKGMGALGVSIGETGNWLTIALQVSIGLVIVGLAAYAIMAPDKVRRLFTGRQARYGSNSLILAVAFLGIIGVVNYLAYLYPKSWDLTEDKSHTLAPETQQILATLPENVHAVAFYSANLNRSDADQMLQDFQSNSNGKFDYEFIDPDTDPLAAREAGITGDGKILLVMGDRKEISSFASEDELTRTLIRLVSPGTRTIYFLEGHGEPSLATGGQVSFSVAKSTLESKNYAVNSLNLAIDNKVPEDALAIVIAGPIKPITSQEANLLKQYVDAGGSLVVMEDPVQLTEFGDSPDPLADYLVNDWGIALNNDVVIDLEMQNPLVAMSSQYSGTHPITKNMTNNYIVFMPQTRSIGITEKEGITATPLILTTERSWGETNLVANENPQPDPETDFMGPLVLAAAGENPTTKGRVVVFGSSLFATDEWFDTYGNGNIIVNSIDWAAEQEDLLNITPRTPITRSFIPPSGWALVSILIGSIFILPGLVVVAGVSAWLSRRRKG